MRQNLILCLSTIFLFGVLAGITYSDTPSLTEGDGTLRRVHVPILMYHYVSELPPNADDLRVNLTLSPRLFESHLQYFQANNYTTISLQEMHDALLYGEPLPPKPVILTFDDGYLDHYTIVFPLLKQYGFTGTFFIITQFIDEGSVGYLNWEQIREMSAHGMAMEAHTKTHPDLRNRDVDYLVYQIMGSLETLDANLDLDARMFAYPAGRYDDATLKLISTTPIRRAVTTQHGALHTSDNWFEVPRLRITHQTGAAGLAQLLNSR